MLRLQSWSSGEYGVYLHCHRAARSILARSVSSWKRRIYGSKEGNLKNHFQIWQSIIISSPWTLPIFLTVSLVFLLFKILQYYTSNIHFQFLCFMAGCSRCVSVKAMDCRIVVSEFELQSCYYVHFRANTLGKGMNPPAMGK